MVGFIPRKKLDLKSDDINDIETNVVKLAQKYLLPIDAIRSIARPRTSTSHNDDECVFEAEVDGSRPVESRTHAFMRYVGFPVAVKQGQLFYNPGFDPNGSLSKTRRSDINKKFQNADIKKIIDQREEDPEIIRSLFSRQDLSASLYAMLLSTLPRPLLNLTDGTGSLDVDYQEFNIKERQSFAELFFTINDNFSRNEALFLVDIAGATFTKGTHILKPFVVDPAIDCLAMPAKNRVAVPFLKSKDDLKIDQNISVNRPGIELIIRERLRASEVVDTAFLETVRQILNNEISPNTFLVSANSTVDGQTLISTVAALLGDYEIDTNELKELKDITIVQTEIISQLVRTLKGVLQVLYDSIQRVLKAISELNWIPIPNVEGPEFGSRGAVLRIQNSSSIENEIDRTIIKLKRKKITAEHQITSVQDLGDFASPFNVHTNDENLEFITNSLRDAEQKRDQIANDAFVAMGNIELIMGEASGLGLVDVLAVYIALWAMDEKALISMLDNESFERLVANFPDLVVGAAEDRKTLGQPEKSIETALDDFESKLKNVLNFAQIEFSRKLVTDGEEAGGDIYPDQ